MAQTRAVSCQNQEMSVSQADQDGHLVAREEDPKSSSTKENLMEQTIVITMEDSLAQRNTN